MKQLTLLYLIRDAEVLLAMKKRGFGIGKWNGVGGKVDGDETVETAMIRECQEEIGVTPQNYKSAGIMMFDEPFGLKRERVQIHIFICTTWTGTPGESEEMIPGWHPINSLPFNNMWSADVHWLPTVLAGNIIKADFRLDDDEKVTARSLENTGRWQ